MTVVTVLYKRWLTLNRSCIYTLCCVAGHVYVIKPWEKGNSHEFNLDEIV
jgi:hypothetical protein